MIDTATLSFLKSLEKNNNKDWFDKHRKEYEQAKKNFEEFTQSLIEGLSVVDKSIEGQEAKKSIFRIFRDVRFSKDKTPYKAHMSAYFSRAGRKAPDAGYYIHIQPGKSFLAAGLWMPDSALLKAVRQEIDYNFIDFKSAITKPPFKKLFGELEGDKLKTLPQGYTPDNPAIDYLKMKSFIASIELEDKVVLSDSFKDKVIKIFTEAKPLIDFLNKALD